MIIGTIYLLSVLFGGGMQLFLLDKLEKGVKTFITEKDRKKEILLDLSESKKMIKAFYKDRKSKLKTFKAMSADRNISRTAIEKYYAERYTERLEFQEKVINARIHVVNKINQDEWDNIISMSAEKVASGKEKAAKKNSKDNYSGVTSAINKSIEDNDRAQKALVLLDDLKSSFNTLTNKLSSVNAQDNDILTNKDASSEELKQLAASGNTLRNDAFKTFLDFHFEMKDITSEPEWDDIMKEFNKILF